MRRSFIHWIVAGLALACIQPVNASAFNLKKLNPNADQKPMTNYMGASISSTYNNDLCQGIDNCQEHGRSWKAYSGVRFSESIMLEGAYINFGEQTGIIHTDTDNAQNYSQKSTAYTAAATISHRLSDTLDLFGKGGLMWWKTKQAMTDGNQEQSGTDLFYGAGANYHFGNNMAVRAEWERFDGLPNASTEKPTAIDLLSVGVIFTSL